MRPLAVAHALVDDEEEPDRRAEESIIAGEMHEPPGFVFAAHAQQCVELLANFVAARAKRLPHIRWIDKALARVAGEVVACKVDDRIPFGASDRDHTPGLQIAARGRVARDLKDIAYNAFGHRIGFERTYGNALAQRVADVHRGARSEPRMRLTMARPRFCASMISVASISCASAEARSRAA